MNTQQALFTEILDIPEPHMKVFIVCNSSPTQTFYLLKDKILRKYGKQNDYDLQVIKQTCWSCEGTGVFRSDWKLAETCWSCGGDGVFRTKKILLERWLINGNLFHIPNREVSSVGSNYIVKNIIQGYIRHENKEGNPQYCLYYLMWNYDKQMFFKCLESDIKCYCKRERLKFQRLLRKHNPLTAIAEFLKVKKQDTEDLPF